MKQSTTMFRRDVIGWSLYDFANTIYSMNIVSLYLKRYIVEDLQKDHLFFDIPFSLSMLLAGVLLPALGAMSDHSTKKKIFLFLFTLTCCLAVGLMAVVPPEFFVLTAILFMIANFSYEAGQPFYNSLLYSVSDGRQARYISGVGVALGYVGSIFGMLVVLPFVTGSVFSLDIPLLAGGGKTASFVPTAVLFMLFALPLFWWVRERKVTSVAKTSFKGAYREVWDGLRHTRKYPGVLRFLIADYFVEDAVATVILNIGIYCSIVLRLPDEAITLFLVISTVSAVIGSYLIGRIAQIWSLKRILYGIMFGWAITLIMFVMTDNMTVIWILGSLVGILLGGLWTTTRPMLAELVPRDQLGRFFGLFSLSGRAAAVIGPLIWTMILYLFDADRALGKATADLFGLDAVWAEKLPYKLGILSLVFMILIGLFIFRKVPQTHGGKHV
jgi:UMF1 family MFS transporter